MVRRITIRPGETILIHGGAGGVGSFAVQIAAAAGANVLATASAGHQDTLRELGAAIPIDYGQQDPIKVALDKTGGEGVDAVFDCVGQDLVGRSIPAVKPHGRLACILAPGGDLSALSRRNLTLHGIFLTRERRRLEELRNLIEMGKLKPVVDGVLPLERAAEAHRRLDTGHGRGKVVLTIRQ